MKKLIVLLVVFMLNACTTKYILMDENGNPVKKGQYTENVGANQEERLVADESLGYEESDDRISADNVFVVSEGSDFVTYQYKNVRVDEISPMASLYCADTSFGASPYLREVSMYHNGFMRATFDCVSLAI